MLIRIKLSKQNKVFIGNHTEFGLTFDTNIEQEYMGQIVPKSPKYTLHFKNENVKITKRQANNLANFLAKVR